MLTPARAVLSSVLVEMLTTGRPVMSGARREPKVQLTVWAAVLWGWRQMTSKGGSGQGQGGEGLALRSVYTHGPPSKPIQYTHALVVEAATSSIASSSLQPQALGFHGRDACRPIAGPPLRQAIDRPVTRVCWERGVIKGQS